MHERSVIEPEDGTCKITATKDTGVYAMQLKSLSALLLALAALLVSPFALAHSAAGHTAGLVDGFMHPATGLEHLLIAIAAGFWAARSADHAVADMAYFLSLLLGGMLLGLCCLMFPQLHLQAMLIMVLTTVFIASTIAAPRYFAWIFFGSFAVYHGIAHIVEMPELVSVGGYLTGLVLSTGLLMMLGLVLRQVVVTRKPRPLRGTKP